MSASIIHAGDESIIVFIARVSSNQDNTDPGLLSYLIRQNHWSPFEMISACVEINTTRDIGRQILRHRSFSFQEFSQRYATVSAAIAQRDMRKKGGTNRQGSLPISDPVAEGMARGVAATAFDVYDRLIQSGIAPECARAVLPEGFTPTKLYMHGTLRSWIHYLRERLKLDPVAGRPYAQFEHYELALEIESILRDRFPIVFAALDDLGYLGA